MDPSMPPIDAWGAAAAVALAVVQVLVARRVDLAPAVLSVVAATGLLFPVLSEVALVGVVGALVVSVIGAWRASSAGVGRPELGACVLALAGVAHLALVMLPARTSLDVATLRSAVVGPVLLLGAVTVLLALERRGLRGQRVHHHREVPVGSRGSSA